MMGGVITYTFIVVYVFLFSWQCYKQKAGCWFFMSLAFWVIFAAIGVAVLPGLSGLFKPMNLYLVPLYVFLGSFSIKSQSVRQKGAYLGSLAISGWMQYGTVLIWLVLLFCLTNHIPVKVPALVYIMQLVFLQPLFWIGCQWILMGLLYKSDYAEKKPVLRLQGLVLFTLLCQLTYVSLGLTGKI